MLWLPPLGYSPQFAAFNLIVLAVGHHALQHCYVLMAHHHVFISCKTTKQNFAWQKSSQYQPDRTADSILIPTRLHTKKCFSISFLTKIR